MDDIFTELNIETLATVFQREIIVPSIVQSISNQKIERLDVTAMEIKFDCVNFVKKTKRITAGHRLALEVLEAPQQTEPAMYLKLTLYGRNKCILSIQGVFSDSLKV